MMVKAAVEERSVQARSEPVLGLLPPPALPSVATTLTGAARHQHSPFRAQVEVN
jgi:hypothetical protein